MTRKQFVPDGWVNLFDAIEQIGPQIDEQWQPGDSEASPPGDFDWQCTCKANAEMCKVGAWLSRAYMDIANHSVPVGGLSDSAIEAELNRLTILHGRQAATESFVTPFTGTDDDWQELRDLVSALTNEELPSSLCNTGVSKAERETLWELTLEPISRAIEAAKARKLTTKQVRDFLDGSNDISDHEFRSFTALSANRLHELKRDYSPDIRQERVRAWERCAKAKEELQNLVASDPQKARARIQWENGDQDKIEKGRLKEWRKPEPPACLKDGTVRDDKKLGHMIFRIEGLLPTEFPIIKKNKEKLGRPTINDDEKLEQVRHLITESGIDRSEAIRQIAAVSGGHSQQAVRKRLRRKLK